MDFSLLVALFEKVSSTNKRLEILDFLSEFFIKIKENPEYSKNLEKIVYLMRGTLYPEILEQPKLGLAEKSLIDFLSRYYSVDLNKLKTHVRKSGDLGVTAESIARKLKSKKGQITSFIGIKEDTLSVSNIYQKLEEIAKISGAKSLDKKFSKLKWLLARSNPKMVKYIIKIILSNLRLRVADPTIMDSLAVAYFDNKAMRSEIERAYNVHPDLGYIARIIHEDGLKGLKEINIQVGTPIRMMLASRLNYTQIFPKLGGKNFVSEFKLDGERLQIHKNGNKVKIFSRKLKDISNQYPDVQKSVIDNIDADKAIIEGEAVAIDEFDEMLPFQVLITRKRKYDIEGTVKKVRVCVFIFDLLYLERNDNKEEVMDYPLLKRRSLLKEIIKQTDTIRIVKGKIINSTDELVEFFKESKLNRCEGLMNKSIDPDTSVYKAGNRGFLWIKLKSLEAGRLSDSIDAVVIGANWGKGRRANRFGALIVAVLNAKTGKFEMITRVASGFSDDDLDGFTETFKELTVTKKAENVICGEKLDVWFKPAVVVEIVGDELTVSSTADLGYSVRFPVFQRIRDDKGRDDITTVEEIKNLYEAQ